MMSQDQSNLKHPKHPSVEDLEHYKKAKLLEFLKSRGVKQNKSAKRSVILSVAKLVATRPVITVSPDENLPLQSESDLSWKDAASEVPTIPAGFTLETITQYLREIPCKLSWQGEDEELEVISGTDKPVIKGRRMYASMKLQMAEWAEC